MRQRRPSVVEVAAVLLSVAMGPSIASAGTECTVRLFPPGADEAWRLAAKDVEDAAHALPSGSTDCAEIAIEVAKDRASVTLVTRDGRRAVRPVGSPRELAPTVEALFVTLPAPTPASSGTPPPVDATPPREEPASPPAAAPTLPAVDRTLPNAFMIGASVGGRLGLPGAFASPGIAAHAGGHVGHWELAIRGEWNPISSVLGSGVPPGFRSTQFLFGLSGGRREQIGTVPIAFGLFGGAGHFAWTSPSTGQTEQQGGSEGNVDENTGNNEDNQDAALIEGSKLEPRAGLYAGTWFPRIGSLRVRPEILLDVVVSRLGRTLATESGVALPWWSLAIAVGVEGDIR